jgi:hypothetical protein
MVCIGLSSASIYTLSLQASWYFIARYVFCSEFFNNTYPDPIYVRGRPASSVCRYSPPEFKEPIGPNMTEKEVDESR